MYLLQACVTGSLGPYLTHLTTQSGRCVWRIDAGGH